MRKLIKIERTETEEKVYVEGVKEPVYALGYNDCLQMLRNHPMQWLQHDEKLIVETLKSKRLPSDFRECLEAWKNETQKIVEPKDKTYLLLYNSDPKTKEEWQYQLISHIKLPASNS